MKLPPAIVHLRVITPESRPIRLWLPVFLLWPLLLVIAVLALVVTALVDVALIAGGNSYHHYSVLLVRSLGLLADTRGTNVRIRSARSTVDLTVA